MTAIAIIGAMDEEVANIATALSNVTVTEEAGVKVTRGTLETNKGTAVNVAATRLISLNSVVFFEQNAVIFPT